MKEDKIQFIEYHRNNTLRANKNRKTMTKAEARIRFEILQYRPRGYKFIRQKMIGPFILDFYCSKLLLGIEIDGSSHDGKEDHDAMREHYIRKKGIKIIRYRNEDILYDIEYVYISLKKEIEERK